MNPYERRLIELTREQCEKEFNSRSSSIIPSNKNSPSPGPPADPASRLESTSTSLAFATVDVFTSIPFKGNQLAVVQVPIASEVDLETKQAIAREFNFSETVFISPPPGGPGGDRHIRIFTIKGELPFAGHPVIGAAYYICQHLEPRSEAMTLECLAGPVKVRYNRMERMAEVDVPHNIHIHRKPASLAAVLGNQTWNPTLSAKPSIGLPVISIVKGMAFVLIKVTSTEMIASGPAAVDTSSVELDAEWSQSFVGCYFYAIASPAGAEKTEIGTRMLEASVGEDAATGSAACTLACFLALKDGLPGRKYQYVIKQGVEMGRASEIHVDVTLSPKSLLSVASVVLAGRSVLVTEGKLQLPYS